MRINAINPIFQSTRCFTASAQALKYKKWIDLSKKDKQSFIRGYVDMYKEKNPCSKSNLMHRSLMGEMEEHDDTPYVFGILYNEIRAVALGESQDNIKGSGHLGDPSFEKLLFK
ncbi:LAMI_0D00474g1_1 [Lachancea mirantina]|uniref:LAMI_0D00474g1_1 n=1 Tax=Lachancea mirantina TaxID=1230905 RepID=A0A1G4J877_9SACH|nr:LAMI_0D00474g1_1 [Lachancea mirantina]